MRNVPPSWLAVSVLCATSACTFHPEYHPVSVRQFTQTVSVPASHLDATAPAARSPVLVVPPPASSPWWRDTDDEE
jgi:hypothetical protein